MDKKALQRVVAFLGEARSILEEEQGKAQDQFDEKSEKWQESDAGTKAADKIENLSEALISLEDVESHIETAIND